MDNDFRHAGLGSHPEAQGKGDTIDVEPAEPLRFGCDECALRHTAHCEDCLVTHMCREDDGSVVVSIDELRLVRQLQSGGLAPPLRHRRTTG